MDDQKQKTLKTIAGLLTAFLLSATSSYAITSYLYPSGADPLTPGSTPSSEGGLVIDPSAPKTESCPINGKMYTEIEREVWETRRPLFIMIENTSDSRPQSGLNSADVIYEAVAEGGITRFGAVFYCGISAKDTIIGPVRSARTYFLDWASEYNYPLYTHVGGANCSPIDPDNAARTCQSDKRTQALEQINSYGWGGSKGNDLNQFSIGFPTFWRDYERLGRTVATEHTMYTSTEKLTKYAKKRGWTNLSPEGNDWADDYVSFKFLDEEDTQIGSVNKISFGFWESWEDFNVVWNYDSTSNAYKRDNGGAIHIDLNDDSQLTVSVIIVQFTKEIGPVDDLKHILYDTESSGNSLVFQNGKVIKGTWEKKDRELRTIFSDSKGKEIEFNRGKIFIEIVPKGNEVEY